jgi:hypothetical protein
MKANEYRIHRNARGSYSILFEDGSVSVSFLPSRREAEAHLAWMIAQDNAALARELRSGDMEATVLASAQAVRP